MRVAKLTAFHVRIPLRKTIRHASHTRTFNDTLVVRCRLDDGTTGWGEGLPRAYVTGETIETAFTVLRDTDPAAALAEPWQDGLRGAVGVLDRLELDTRCGTGRDCFGNAVRCAVELAVLDAAARVEGVPLSRVSELVPETAGIRQSAEEVFYSGAITSASAVREYVSAWKMRLYAFRQVKVKVGVVGVDDAASLRRIRNVLGDDVDIRIDANEAWTCENLVERMAPLQEFGVSALEQPVPHADVDGLAAIRPVLDTPLMLDESLCSLSDAHRAIERGTCDVFNVRLSKCGGLLNSLRIAATADRAGLAYQLGCQVGETGILSAAGRHFACSVGGIRYLEGSYDRHLVREPLTVEDLTFGYRGRAPALTGPGLGVTVDESAVERVCIAREAWCPR